MRDHTKYKAFELADQLVIIIYEVTRGFPREEMYGLTSQMRRSAISIPSNIVEGCGRETEKEFLRFLEIAFSSLRELKYQVSISQRIGYFKDEDALDFQIVETEKVLASLIKIIKRESVKN